MRNKTENFFSGRRIACGMCTSRVVFAVLFAAILAFGAIPQKGKKEIDNHYKRWLDRDVIYLISEEEKAVFRKLNTPEEKDAFIEQFWLRRNPNSATAANEIKEEHYRRIAYANERFASGIEGWATDRGRTYIMFGPPKSVDRNPTGEKYLRNAAEGGGETMTYPYETWYYDHIEGVGDGINLEFVDPSFTGEYRLALNPYEKDALLDKPGTLGGTFDEQQGLVSKRARLDMLFMGRASYPEGHTLADRSLQPFENLDRYFNLRRPAEVKFPDLRSAVTTRVTYGSAFPVGFTYQYMYLDKQHCLVPASFSFRLTDLTAKNSGIGENAVKVNIYGKVTDLTQRVNYEFEDSMSQFLAPDESKTSVFFYEKKLPLKPGRYKLTAVVKDENSSQIAIVEKALVIPQMSEDSLALSSVNVLAGFRRVNADVSLTEPFVVPGGVKVYPNMEGKFEKKNGSMVIQFEIYRCAFSQDTGLPQVGANLTFSDKDGKVVLLERLPRSSLKLVGTRVVVLHQVDLAPFAPGNYRLHASAYDAIKDEEASGTASFSVIDSRSP